MLRRVVVVVRESDAEEARARLLELVPAGFEERDVAGTVELAAYVDGSDTEAALRAAFVDVSSSVVEPGWEEAWRSFHRPVIAGGIWIGPPWHSAPDGMPSVVIDPGLAFGTGAHATTRLCIELLAGLERGSLLDVGCGSGVLSIVAERLGFGPLTAVDVDDVAVGTARANASANDVRLAARVVDAVAGSLPRAAVAVANVSLDVVETVLRRLAAADVVTSGYPAGERPEAFGWEHVVSRELDGWAADHFRRRRRAANDEPMR